MKFFYNYLIVLKKNFGLKSSNPFIINIKKELIYLLITLTKRKNFNPFFFFESKVQDHFSPLHELLRKNFNELPKRNLTSFEKFLKENTVLQGFIKFVLFPVSLNDYLSFFGLLKKPLQPDHDISISLGRNIFIQREKMRNYIFYFRIFLKILSKK